jgi:hypothetical protein
VLINALCLVQASADPAALGRGPIFAMLRLILHLPVHELPGPGHG